MPGRTADLQPRLIGIEAQVATIALPTVRQHVNGKRQRPPAPGADGILFANALMALSPVENMAHHPVRQPNDNPEHRREERYCIAMRPVTLQKKRGNRSAHRMGKDKPFSPVSRNHLLLPERGQVINIVAEVNHVSAVGI